MKITCIDYHAGKHHHARDTLPVVAQQHTKYNRVAMQLTLTNKVKKAAKHFLDVKKGSAKKGGKNSGKVCGAKN